MNEGSTTQIVAGLQILSSWFLAYQIVKFITLQCVEIPYVWGPLGSPKVNEACQSQHFAKIQEMKSISKPRTLANWNLRLLSKSFNRRFRKESTLTSTALVGSNSGLQIKKGGDRKPPPFFLPRRDSASGNESAGLLEHGKTTFASSCPLFLNPQTRFLIIRYWHPLLRSSLWNENFISS